MSPGASVELPPVEVPAFPPGLAVLPVVAGELGVVELAPGSEPPGVALEPEPAGAPVLPPGAAAGASGPQAASKQITAAADADEVQVLG